MAARKGGKASPKQESVSMLKELSTKAGAEQETPERARRELDAEITAHDAKIALGPYKTKPEA